MLTHTGLRPLGCGVVIDKRLHQSKLVEVCFGWGKGLILGGQRYLFFTHKHLLVVCRFNSTVYRLRILLCVGFPVSLPPFWWFQVTLCANDGQRRPIQAEQGLSGAILINLAMDFEEASWVFNRVQVSGLYYW